MHTDTADALFDCMLGNTDARFEPEEEFYEPKGSAIGIATLSFLTDNGFDCYKAMVRSAQKTPMKLRIPFDQKEKFSASIRFDQHDNTTVNIFVKGAPETILKHCEQYWHHEGRIVQPDGDWLEKKLAIISNHMASSGLKPLSYASKTMSLEDLENFADSYGIESEEFL